MIGKIAWFSMPYYDMSAGKMSFKKRPALILAEDQNHDYTILPFSTVSRKENINPVYDIEIDVTVYAKLGLSRNCYIRTHKQTTAHRGAMITVSGDMKRDYRDLFDDVLLHLEQFNNSVFDLAAT